MPKKNPHPPVWDKHAIKAAISRKGKTLTQLALDNGLSEGAIRVALAKPFPAAEQAISKFLGVSQHELWPERKKLTDDNRNNTRQCTNKARTNTSGNMTRSSVEKLSAA